MIDGRLCLIKCNTCADTHKCLFLLCHYHLYLTPKLCVHLNNVMALPIIKHKKKTASYYTPSSATILTCCTCMMGGAQMCMHSTRKPAISSYLKWALSRYYRRVPLISPPSILFAPTHFIWLIRVFLQSFDMKPFF